VPVPAGIAERPVAAGRRADVAHAQHREDGETSLTVSIPLVVILGVAVFVAYRYMGLRVWQVILCLLFGFLLAATTAAPDIRDTLAAIVQWLGSFHT